MFTINRIDLLQVAVLEYENRLMRMEIEIDILLYTLHRLDKRRTKFKKELFAKIEAQHDYYLKEHAQYIQIKSQLDYLEKEIHARKKKGQSPKR